MNFNLCAFIANICGFFDCVKLSNKRNFSAFPIGFWIGEVKILDESIRSLICSFWKQLNSAELFGAAHLIFKIGTIAAHRL